MHINIPSSFAVEMFKYIYSIDICSDFQCILTRKLKIETSSKPLQHTPKAMFLRLMRCNVYNYASTCMFPFRKNRFSMPRSHYFFLKNSLCYLIFALVCNIFGLVKELFHNEMYSMTRDGLALAVSRVIRYTRVSLDVI